MVNRKSTAHRAGVWAMVLIGATQSQVALAGWQVSFADEFNGTSLDRAKWATRYAHADGTLARLKDEDQRYTDDQSHIVEDGVLSLVARSAPVGDEALFHSGMIRSRQTFYYGYFEARVFLPEARGIWGAFWLNSDYSADGRLDWPPEIDAFEYVIEGRYETPDMIHSSVKVGRTGVQGGKWLFRDAAFDERWSFIRANAPLNKSWQVVGTLWTPTSVSSFLNGKKLYTREYNWLYDDGTLAPPAHVLLNLAIGGSWAGRNGIDVARFPQRMKVDYVRVCQYVDVGGTDRCAGSPYAPTSAEGHYETAWHDLPKTILSEAQFGPATIRAGGRLHVSYVFEAVPTAANHEVRSQLLDQAGKVILTVSTKPPTPTSKWMDRQEVAQTIEVPKGTAPGVYDVLVSVGSNHRNIPIVGSSTRFGLRDGKLRLKVGSARIVR